MIKNFRRHSWLLLYLFGASPALSKTFLSGNQHCLKELKNDTLFLPYATSLRMSDLGYTTNAQSSLNICFNHLDTYIKSLTDAIHTPYPAYEKIGLQVDGLYKQLATTVLQIENEYYNDIRPKRLPGYNETPLQALQKGGVEYIEVRNTDINPLLPLGLDLQQALFMDIFLISCLLMNDHRFTQEECNKAHDNLKLVTTRGREPGLQLANANGKISLKDSANQLISNLEETARILDRLHSTNKFTLSIKAQTKKVEDATTTPSARVLNSIEQSQMEYTDWIVLQSKAHKKTLLQSPKNEKLMKHLAREAATSIDKQRELEENDTLEFDDYLRLHRTGVKTNAAELHSAINE
jgi:glutamate--cysteine ligase